MKRKKQLLMAMLCVFSMLSNSAAVVAQSEDKKQESKSSPQQETAGPNAASQVGEFPQGPAFHIASEVPGQEGPQVEFVHNGISFDSKVVKDKPYSADAVTETVQTLSSGNQDCSELLGQDLSRQRWPHAPRAGDEGGRAVGCLRRCSDHDLHLRPGLLRL
jgi:hypothetical protein